MEIEPLRETIRYMHTIDVVCLVGMGIAIACGIIAIVLTSLVRGRSAAQYAHLSANLASVQQSLRTTEDHIEQLLLIFSREKPVCSAMQPKRRAKGSRAQAEKPAVAAPVVALTPSA